MLLLSKMAQPRAKSSLPPGVAEVRTQAGMLAWTAKSGRVVQSLGYTRCAPLFCADQANKWGGVANAPRVCGGTLVWYPNQ